MGKQDEQRDDPLAPEVIQALTDFARLAQHASSVAADAPERFAGLLLERLLALCAAQCGALFLTSGDRPLPEQERLPAFFYEEGLRTVALRNINEEKAHDLLAVAPDANVSVATATSSMSGWPAKLAVRPATSVMSSTQKRRMSTSWIECSSSAPEPATAASPRHVDA